MASAVSAMVIAVVIAVPVAGATVGAASAAPTAKSSGTAKAKVKVKVGDNFFKPKEIEVVAGTKVVWTNKGRILHTVTPDKGKAYGIKKLGTGSTYSYKFKKPGEYAYYCALHGSPGSGQYGTIVVTEAPPPTTTTSSAPNAG
jgi:plastocyanin